MKEGKFIGVPLNNYLTGIEANTLQEYAKNSHQLYELTFDYIYNID